jgi:hypothetical protein
MISERGRTACEKASGYNLRGVGAWIGCLAAGVDLPHAVQRWDNEVKALTLGDFTQLYPLRFQCAAYCPFIASV